MLIGANWEWDWDTWWIFSHEERIIYGRLKNIFFWECDRYFSPSMMRYFMG